MNKELYLIVCLRYSNSMGHDFLLLCGKNRCGYVTNLFDAGLYTKEEAEKICLGIHGEDVYIPLSYIRVSPEELQNVNKEVWKVIYKSDRIYNYIEQQKVKLRIKQRRRYKEAM